MGGMKLATQLMYDGNPRRAADSVAALEKAGLDRVWVAEAYGFDSPTLMGYLAAKTETVEIGSAILNIYSRTPGALLQTAAGLDNVSGGRAILGLGASGPQVIEGFHGVPYSKPLTRTAEIVDIVRRGLRREPLTSDGEYHLPLGKEHGAVTGLGKPLKLLTRPERDTIPIWIAALGASGPQVIEGFHGVPYAKPLARTAEIVDIVRRGLKREPLTADGEFHLPLGKEHGAVTGLGKPLKLLTRPERDTIPIWIAALGPKSVEQTAEIADGWIPHLFHPERAASVWGDSLARGNAKRQEGLGPLEVMAGGMVAIGEGPETKALLDFARPLFALYVGGMGARTKNFYNDVAKAYGYEEEAEKIQDLYLSGRKRDAEALVPTEWLEASNLVGPASYVKERIEAFREAGVTTLHVHPASDDPPATIAAVREMLG